ncbi:MAG: hypothetical protein DRI83_10785, partial [Bacteroidetes bacterium]
MSLGDVGPLQRTLKWSPVSLIKITDTRFVSELTFDGASYNYETADLPVFSERFAIGNSNIRVEAIISDEVWESIDETAIKRINGYEMITSGLEVKT